MKKLIQNILLILLILSGSGLLAQFDTEEFDSLENQILYNRQRTYGIIAHSLGVGIQFRTGKRITYFKTRMLSFEFVTMRSYNQVKMVNPYVPDSRRYVYGKLNDAFFLRAGMIWKKLLNRKPYWGGVELRFIYGGGVSLGLAKPYYYYTFYITQNPNGPDSYIQKTERFSEDIENFYGRAPFTKGLGEITLHPGVYGTVGLNFEFGKRNTRIRSLEVGATMDAIPLGLSILAKNSDQIFFPTAYLKFSFGKRFNKY
jgi:hypothetical protein